MKTKSEFDHDDTEYALIGQAVTVTPTEEETVSEAPDSPDQKDAAAGEDVLGTKRQVIGAAVAGGLVGSIFGGTILGAAGAAGGAVLATKEGKMGHWARSSGDLMANTGDRLKKMDEKHRFIEKTTGWINQQLEPAMDRIKSNSPSEGSASKD